MLGRTSPEPAHLFYSYAHEDGALRRRLEKHLSLLHRGGLLASWHDRKIQAGTEWKQEIDEHLNTASLILLLISPDFLASDYCYEYEMQQAMERHRRGEARVIPVILRPCSWQGAPFGALQPLPRNGQPITKWENQDDAFLEIAQSLREFIEPPQKAPDAPLSATVTSKNREAMLLRLQSMYKELLTSSLQETAWIELGLWEQPGAVQNAANLILRRSTQPTRPLPPGTPVREVYQEANHELLILGAPGAGKSTLLYQLGCDLLMEASQQETQPLPVIFPLSSWAEKHLSLADWMVEQLASPLYMVPRKQSQQWVQNQQILPLLDGLDEMEEEARPACIAAINAYRWKYPLCPLVVCSRSDEYQGATSVSRLHLQNAIEVQPLTPEQMETALLLAGQPVAALRSELNGNAELRDLARTPLWLNVLLLTFKNTSIDALPQQYATLQQQVCAWYVQRMIEGKGNNKRYPLAQTKHWLRFLAQQMSTRNLTVFAVEQMQPDWLIRGPRRDYRWSSGLVFGLLFWLGSGLVFGLLGWVSFGVRLFAESISWSWENAWSGLFGWLPAGLAVGLATGLFGWLIGWHTKKIELAESISWSWKDFRSVDELVDVLGYTVTFGLVFWLIGWLVSWPHYGLLTGLAAGMLVGMLFGPPLGLFLVLLHNLTPNPYLEHSTLSPGEGLRRSWKNGLVTGLVGWLVGGLAVGLLFGLVNRLIFGPMLGLVGGLVTGLTGGLITELPLGLLRGGGAVIQHFLLRIFLWRAGVFPFRAIAFLEDARARHLLRRIGGSYQFVHRLVLDYFVDLDSAR